MNRMHALDSPKYLSYVSSNALRTFNGTLYSTSSSGPGLHPQIYEHWLLYLDLCATSTPSSALAIAVQTSLG
jgi:hypothetical protein